MTESYKLLICKSGIYIILAAVLLKMIISGVYYRPTANLPESTYREYIGQVSGKITDEKLSYIEQEGDYINSTISKYSEMKTAYQSGQMTPEDYQSYLGRYNYANFSKNAFERLFVRRDYLLRVNSSHDNIEFIYEEGLNRMLEASIDIPAVMTAIFICCNMFSFEYDSGFYKILRLAKKGRGVVFRDKTVLAVLTSAAVFILFSTVDICYIIKYYNIAYLSANILSIPNFNEFPTDMSVLSYIVLYKAISFAGYEVCFLFAAALSVLLENKIKTITISALAIFIPFVIQYYDIPFLKYISISYLMSPKNILQGFAAGVVCTAFTLLALNAAYHKWNGKGYVAGETKYKRNHKIVQ